MSYIVIERFADLQDGNRIYEAGDKYPRPGFDVSDERLAELAGSDNRIGYALIEAVESPSDAVYTEHKETIVEAVNDAPIRHRSRKRG